MRQRAPVRTRRAFVAVVAAQVATYATSSASANPPAPSSVPDPPQTVAPQPGELATRIKRHDGGCFAYTPSGGVTRTKCPAGVSEPGEELIREPETGECVIFEPWGEEPKDTPCPAELVPPGFEPPKPKVQPKYAVAQPTPTPQPASLETAEPAKSAGCSRCAMTNEPSSSALAPLAAVGVAAVVARRRSERRSRTT